VVADSKDVIALERTHEYRGKYHVLGGVIDPMNGLGPDELNITALVRRVSQQDFEEVIIAINPSVEGETTTLYLGQLLKPFFVRVTRIAYGLAVGSELDCADEITLAIAMNGRRELD
jgi:recombination protein RecR